MGLGHDGLIYMYSVIDFSCFLSRLGPACLPGILGPIANVIPLDIGLSRKDLLPVFMVE